MFLSAYQNKLYALMRITVGFAFLWHGSQKVVGFPPAAMEMTPLLLAAGIIELVGGVLVMVGLFGGWAAFVCSGTMAAAYWLAHGLKAPLPIQNHGELAFLYCFVFLFIAARGSGIWSVDAARGA